MRDRCIERGICVIIPTYNNAGTIVDVTRRAMEQCRDVIVVCDGCTDNTLELLHAMPQQPVILDLKTNRGKGTALKEGFRYALQAGFAYAITLDGDGQHFPEDIPVLVQANIDNPGALIVGQRKGLESVERSKGSRFANSFSNFWFTMQTGHYLSDTQTGYRLYPLKKLHGLSLLTSRYEAELELMVFASWNGVRLVSAPVNVYYPPSEERVSHFRPGPDFTRISILNTVLCFLAVVYGLPRAILRLLMTVLRTFYALVLFVAYTMFFLTPLTFLYMGIGGVTEKKKDWMHRHICRISRFILTRHGIPGVKYTSENPDGEDFSKPSVIICNHQSHLDLLPMLALTPKIIVLTSNWVWKSPFFGYTIRMADFLPASSGIDAILPHLQAMVAKGYSIVVYPEGTRSPDCRIGRFHQGAFYLAQQLGIDVMTTVVYGSGKALPKHGRYLRRWPMVFRVGRRIDNAALAQMGPSLREISSNMRKHYIEEYTHLADRIERDV